MTSVSADKLSINVTGWTVPGSSHIATGQIPSSTLDTYRSSYSAQTAFLGVQTNAFARNTVVSFNPTVSADAGWQTHNYQGEELDVFDSDTQDYRM